MIYWKKKHSFKKIWYNEFTSIKDFKGQQGNSHVKNTWQQAWYQMQFEPQKLNDKKKIKSMLSSNLHIYAMSDVHLEICTQIHTDKQVYTLMVTEKGIQLTKM